MPVAEVNGQSVHYTDTGGEQLPVVAFSHGFLMSGEMFAPQIEALRDRNRCIAWDERGHGGTPVGGAFSYYESADDLYALLTSLGVTGAVLVGMSQGGYLMLVVGGEQDAAITEQHALELARGIVGSEFVRIPDAGHAANLTHPELVTPHLERFLAAVYPAA